ncbi:CheR family methyltransferase [Desulfurivibrio alkaliphilus]|uniref:protein-glutamate O-methyltransferase n=1 Tax=Desulfurivibrio alkaliphilus (strain DSM 19089 / UNIQEM U267 / AHT2) TaxID=589865 RepID=D6Z1B0_DESAT|nr:protein-glutamate O-methyltransferase CheR [Desulfurivibrio alkaliphilus]ADH85365.1 MCP methyltransferase, CheR-type [Desulfurivibrio alkaliphilus AHT 2]
MNQVLTISDREFSLIRNLVYERFGINLTEQKRSLVVGRLQKLLRTEGYQTFQEYHEALVADTSGAALDKLINRISTNYTYFNREQAHFDFFHQEVLPALINRQRANREQDLRIWSAGCSSGEEPYYLNILMMEQLGGEYAAWRAGVLATDISDQALCKARRGLYEDDQVSRLPLLLRNKYFDRQPNGSWQARENLRREVTFRRFNLMNRQFCFKKGFQVIFCRNVMIYFDTATRQALVRRFHHCLEPGGYLFIGHSETLGREQSDFQYLMPAVYRRR